MIKTLFLTGEYPPMQGGIADHTAYLAHHLIALNAAPSILTSRRWLETDANSSPLLADVMARHPVIHPLVPDWGWHCWPAVTRFLAIYRPEVLHIQYQAAAFDLGGWINWLPWYLRRRGVTTRVVTTFHDLRLPYVLPKAGPLRWKSILALACQSHAVICTNREDFQTLQHHLFERSRSKRRTSQPPRLTLIRLGSNVEPQPPTDFDRTAWRKIYNGHGHTLLLAYFGFLNESKGGEELIESLALVRRQGIDARLLLIGGDVGHADSTNITYAQRVQTLIESHDLDHVVYRTGYLELGDISANLLAADAVVMPYRDGVSFRRTTLIAALRHGCPVISTSPADPSLIPEIQPGQNMLLVPPGNAAALARTIVTLAKDTVLRRRLAAGAKRLGSLFEWPEIAEQTLALYQTVTA